MSAQSTAAKRLWKEYRDIADPRSGLKQVQVEVDDENVFKWNVALMVIDPESVYYGAYLKGELKFPTNYPFAPPNFKFTPAIYHPNVYSDGRICISILHEAGNETSDEPANETWSPAQSVESVLLSILSLLEDPNIGSPANVDAAIAFKKHKDEYKKRIQNEVSRSQANLPAGFKMPVLEEIRAKPQEEEVVDDDEWWDDEDNYYDDDDMDDDDDDDDDVSTMSE